MPIHNAQVADLFNELADVLDIQGANPFRVRAYRNAARVVRNWPTQFSETIKKGEDLPKIPGIGPDLASKLREAALYGRLTLLDTLKKETPEGLLELLKLPGLGPKRVQLLEKELHVRSIADLQNVAKAGKIRTVKGLGATIESRILEGLAQARKFVKPSGARSQARRMNLAEAEQIAGPLIEYLKSIAGVEQVAIAGSFRRKLETIGDLDILVSCRRDSQVMERFINYEDVVRVVSRGPTRSTVILRSNIQVDVRAVPTRSYGSALHYFTGSKDHNIAIRTLGAKRGLKINEYGVFRGTKRIGGKTEEEIFDSVGLPYIEPELRENRGEIEAAARGELPTTVTLSQIRGDLHAHTRETDGRLSLEEMASAAKKRGYEYLAVTDHSRRLTVAKGLTPSRLRQQIQKIDELNRRTRGFRILKAIEVDILEDGSLDLPDDVLSLLDLTVCSIHSKFNLPERKQTERILRAMRNPHFRILGHPTGRLIGERAAYPVDLERVMRSAKDLGCILEVNAQPERMDLSDIHCRMAKDTGIKLAISTDAHGENDLDYMKYGIAQARRGWIGPEQVVNTRSWAELSLLVRKREAGGTR